MSLSNAAIGTMVIENCANATVDGGPGYAGIVDPVAALVLGPTRPVEYLLVNGEMVVEGGKPRTADPSEMTRESLAASQRSPVAGRGLREAL